MHMVVMKLHEKAEGVSERVREREEVCICKFDGNICKEMRVRVRKNEKIGELAYLWASITSSRIILFCFESCDYSLFTI